MRIYVLTGSLAHRSNHGIAVSDAARRHLAVLGGVWLLVLGFAAYLDVPQLLHSAGGLIHGATNVDVAVQIPALRVLMFAALLGARPCVLPGVRGVVVAEASPPPPSTSRSCGGLRPRRSCSDSSLRQTSRSVRPSTSTTSPPRARRSDWTRSKNARSPATRSSTRADIDANHATLGNVRLWDHEPLLQTFAQIQEIRTYYDFVSVHNDRYMIDGEYRQIMLSARELDSESLPNRNWINERLTFTHGYGVTLGPVNQVTPEGLPVLFIKDLPPQSSVDLEVEQPAIYYGQLSSDHVFVATKAGGVPLPERRGQRLHQLRWHRRRAAREHLSSSTLQHPVHPLACRPSSSAYSRAFSDDGE